MVLQMNLSDIVFAVIAVVELTAIVLMFKSKRMLHAMAAFAMFLFGIAFVLALLGLALLALLQIFIMVGGISTYMFVGVASENLSKFNHTSAIALAVMAIILFLALSYRFYNVQTTQANGINTLSNSNLAKFVGSDVALFYMIALLLFGSGMASIILIKRIGRVSM